MILKHAPSSAISFKRFTQLSLIIKLSADLTAAFVATPRDDVTVDTLYHGELEINQKLGNGVIGCARLHPIHVGYIFILFFNIITNVYISFIVVCIKSISIEIYTKYILYSISQ